MLVKRECMVLVVRFYHAEQWEAYEFSGDTVRHDSTITVLLHISAVVCRKWSHSTTNTMLPIQKLCNIAHSSD